MAHKDRKLTIETAIDDESTSAAPRLHVTDSIENRGTSSTNDHSGTEESTTAGGTSRDITETTPATGDKAQDAPTKTTKSSTIAEPTPVRHSVSPTVAGSTWVGLIIGGIILILLLVFILQNGDTVQLKMFVWTWDFPIGVGMLIAAVAGALIAASVGTVRIFQLRRQVKTGR